ncbi:MAG: phytoene/squalene synthase family protein [Myxococcota bacterium]
MRNWGAAMEPLLFVARSPSEAETMTIEADWQFCRLMLPRVSRTFALNIRILEGELRDAATLAYLLCRILDTIEDDTRLHGETRAGLLNRIADLINVGFNSSSDLEAWLQSAAVVSGKADDVELVRSTDRVVRCLFELDPRLQNAVYRSSENMARGMARFCSAPRFDEFTPLATEADLDDYCYVVAGTVGEMLCGLFTGYYPKLPNDSRTRMDATAVSFGLGLQVTNIAKDFVTDRDRGDCFIPASYFEDEGATRSDLSRVDPRLAGRLLARLARKAIGHLDDAMTYTLAIPRKYWRLRLFCVWPLWMAVATLIRLGRSTEALARGGAVKITRAEVQEILVKTTLRVWSDGLLGSDYQRMREAVLALVEPGDEELKAT